MKKSTQFKLVVLLIIIILSMIMSRTMLRHSSSKERENLIQNRIEHKTELMREYFVGEKLDFLLDITQDSLLYINDFIFVFYYTNNDCNSCINDGFEICDEINIIYGQNIFIIISTSESRYGAYSFVDSEMKFQNKLTSIYSPIFFIFDENFIIRDIYLCDSNAKHNIKKGVKFIKRFLL